MKINVRYLDNLKLEALFDDYNIISDQPVRYKGDGTAPGPFDYFLASSALCAAYFVKLYCKTRNIPTDDISVTQDNIVDPENRYKQTFKIEVSLPESINEKDRKGILSSIDRCTVKKTIQQSPEFLISVKDILGVDKDLTFDEFTQKNSQTAILSKDCTLEETIKNMTAILSSLGIQIEISSWRNPVPHVWSVHIRDAHSPLCYTNGKGATKEAALCSALGEYLERLSCNYFYADYFLGEKISSADFVHYPNEKWFPIPDDDSIPKGLMDEYLLDIYNESGELRASHLIDTNSGNYSRGVCSIPFTRQSDQKPIYIPVNIIGNLFVSNGMSAGNSKYEARVQCLSEIFERAVKNKIIYDQITLPDIPQAHLKKFPKIWDGIQELEAKGYPIVVKDASLGGKFPVVNITLMNPITGGVFASFGAHPKFEVALERTLTELMQGRSFEGLNEMPAPTFNQYAIQEHNNIIDHFIDSTGIISWKFFSQKTDFEYKEWDFSGSTKEEYSYLMQIFTSLEKEVYIADYNHLGASACRIIVPNYSEIYPVDDLIWDNNNKALKFRDDILNLHKLDDQKLKDLVERLEDSEEDNFMPISELIGITFDETSAWGRLTIGELKGLIYLAIEHFDEAKNYIDLFQTFNDNTTERRKFYQVLSILIDIQVNADLCFDDYIPSLNKMYGNDLIQLGINCIKGKIKFYGLPETDSNFKGLDKHLKLIESYIKITTAYSS